MTPFAKNKVATAIAKSYLKQRTVDVPTANSWKALSPVLGGQPLSEIPSHSLLTEGGWDGVLGQLGFHYEEDATEFVMARITFEDGHTQYCLVFKDQGDYSTGNLYFCAEIGKAGVIAHEIEEVEDGIHRDRIIPCSENAGDILRILLVLSECTLEEAGQLTTAEAEWVEDTYQKIEAQTLAILLKNNVKVQGALTTDGSLNIGEEGDEYKIILNGVELELPAAYVPLTLTGAAKVYTSSEAFDGPVHVFIEIDTATTHSSLGLDINTYDAVESFSAGRVLMEGQFYDMFAYLDDEGHVVINLATLGDITDVHARAVSI